MTWNWQLADWPHFRYSTEALALLEGRFLRQSGELSGAVKHLVQDDKQVLTVDLISDEALHTAAIEGEYLNRDSLQSSIRRQFGLQTDLRRIPAAEQGLAELMVNLYETFAAPLTHDTLFAWHTALTKGRRDLAQVGGYRVHNEPMRVISGPVHDPVIHFEAPPSGRMKSEMDRFIGWFNASAPGGEQPMNALGRAGIVHLHFVSVHPFEDGNGRIGRALAEKSLAQCLGQPTLIALAHTIGRDKAAYYSALAEAKGGLEITGWLLYFAKMVLEAQARSASRIEFLIAKARFFERFRGAFNERQEKAIRRVLEDGPDGWPGGLSADKYIRITRTSRATATRDLADLVARQAFTRTGRLKGARYHVNMV